ncbi:MAG: DUF2950 domain-containing protein [Acidobacteria bacterium]|jgi:hypothetical protein|nr:DUF2950 domain-containing protein [Acidobacteriota bacterium]
MRHESTEHTISRRSARVFRPGLCLLLACLVPLAGAAIKQRTFDTPEKAVEAFIAASERYDVEALKTILGDDGVDIVVSEDAVQSKNQAVEFAKVAREKSAIEIDPLDPNVAILSVGPDDWPLPIPIVREGGKWRFDTAAGREELLFRRIGQNELDAIEICLGYVEAQEEYALTRHDGSRINQYAQRVVSTPGKRDGLAWQDPDGTWQGPVGEAIARIIAEGYPEKPTPFHGYTFKILKGQGPAAPLGEMDFMVNGAMIGGFALVAAPADYEVSGVMTFIVSHDGIVYQKDLGPKTAEAFKAMDRYNPDETWSPVFGQ